MAETLKLEETRSLKESRTFGDKLARIGNKIMDMLTSNRPFDERNKAEK